MLDKQSQTQTTIKWWEETSKRERRDQIHLYPPSFTSTHPNHFSLYLPFQIYPAKYTHIQIYTQSYLISSELMHAHTLSEISFISLIFLFFWERSSYHDFSSFCLNIFSYEEWIWWQINSNSYHNLLHIQDLHIV